MHLVLLVLNLLSRWKSTNMACDGSSFMYATYLARIAMSWTGTPLLPSMAG